MKSHAIFLILSYIKIFFFNKMEIVYPFRVALYNILKSNMDFNYRPIKQIKKNKAIKL